jgi:hypothetical protein
MLFLAPLIAAAGFVLFCVGMVAFLLDEDSAEHRRHSSLSRLARHADGTRRWTAAFLPRSAR